MKPTFLIDTVILIDHLNGITQASKWLEERKNGECIISPITYAEVLVGVSKNDESKIIELLEGFTSISIDTKLAQHAASLRRKFRWKLPDAFQAAIAITNNVFLVTRNTKDFDPKKHAFVKVPYTI